MSAQTNLEIAITAKDEASATIKSVENASSSFKSTLMTLGGVIATTFAVGKIVEFGKASVDAALDAERANRQLEHAILDVSKGTRANVDAVNALSDAMQKKSGIDGDALKQGVAQLSTFGLQSATVVKLTKSLADLTVNQNGVNASADQYVQSANMIAKVLNGQFGVLEKSGIRFTEQQQKLIQYGTEAQRVAAIQEGLNQNLRETTDTIGSSAEGAMARVTRAFGEIQESIGGILIPILARAAEALVPLAQGIQEVFDGVSAMGGLGAVFTDLMQKIEESTGLVSFLRRVWNELADEFNTNLKPALLQIWNALQPLMPFLEALGQLVGLVLVAAFMAAVKTLEFFILAIAKIIEVGAPVVDWLMKTLKPSFDAIASTINNIIALVEKMISAFGRVSGAVSGALSSAGKVVGGAISGLAKAGGGSVNPYNTYLVGENGPEFFVPQMSGNIVPNHSLAGAGGGNINITINGAMLTREAGMAMADVILDQLRLKTRIGI